MAAIEVRTRADHQLGEVAWFEDGKGGRHYEVARQGGAYVYRWRQDRTVAWSPWRRIDPDSPVVKTAFP